MSGSPHFGNPLSTWNHQPAREMQDLDVQVPLSLNSMAHSSDAAEKQEDDDDEESET